MTFLTCLLLLADAVGPTRGESLTVVATSALIMNRLYSVNGTVAISGAGGLTVTDFSSGNMSCALQTAGSPVSLTGLCMGTVTASSPSALTLQCYVPSTTSLTVSGAGGASTLSGTSALAVDGTLNLLSGVTALNGAVIGQGGTGRLFLSGLLLASFPPLAQPRRVH
jgi:hypothetical protein